MKGSYLAFGNQNIFALTSPVAESASNSLPDFLPAILRNYSYPEITGNLDSNEFESGLSVVSGGR